MAKRKSRRSRRGRSPFSRRRRSGGAASLVRRLPGGFGSTATLGAIVVGTVGFAGCNMILDRFSPDPQNPGKTTLPPWLVAGWGRVASKAAAGVLLSVVARRFASPTVAKSLIVGTGITCLLDLIVMAWPASRPAQGVKGWDDDAGGAQPQLPGGMGAYSEGDRSMQVDPAAA